MMNDNVKAVGHVGNSAPSVSKSVTNDCGISEQNKDLREDAAGRKFGKKRKSRRYKNRSRRENMPYYKRRIKSAYRDKFNYPQTEAPNNTTQFLMDYHEHEDNLEILNGEKNGHDSPKSASEEEEEFLCRDFSMAYSAYHEQSLASLSKDKLVDIIMKYEDRMDMLQKKLDYKNHVNDISLLLQDSENDNADELKTEAKRLILENTSLHEENDKLKAFIQEHVIVSTSSSSSSSSDSSCSSESDDEKINNSAEADSSVQESK